MELQCAPCKQHAGRRGRLVATAAEQTHRLARLAAAATHPAAKQVSMARTHQAKGLVMAPGSMDGARPRGSRRRPSRERWRRARGDHRPLSTAGNTNGAARHSHSRGSIGSARLSDNANRRRFVFLERNKHCQRSCLHYPNLCSCSLFFPAEYTSPNILPHLMGL